MLATLLVVVPQTQEPPAKPAPIRVELVAKAPADGEGLAWSPKGASVSLAKNGDTLAGTFPLGPVGAPPVRVELSRSPGAEHFDRLALDCNRDGSFGDDERFTAKPKEQRGKWWSSFEATVQVPFGVGDAALRQPYAMSLWFVADPQEPDAPLALRWSRRGWCEGAFEFDGKPVHVLVTEMEMDGVFTTADHWQLGSDRKTMLKAPSRALATHAWCGGRAFRATAVSADGREITVEAFDPGITEAEERDRDDRLKADRLAKRAEKPLAFGKDFAAALADAARTGKRVFVDFETTWCGPCKLMDQYVYTAADVVTAAADVVAVKLDGDEQRELVKRFEVKGYPTLLLLDAKGDVQRREVGYQGVAATVKFLAK
jgi:thiol-disulfide isomerase/thioredoxin